jgi:carboxy-terminal domain RNA polymerase II polypeptide A small phosphatase
MTQTDANGLSLTRAPAPTNMVGTNINVPNTVPNYADNNKGTHKKGGHNTNTGSSDLPGTVKKTRSRLFQWFCCFAPNLQNSSDLENDVDEYAHTAPNTTNSDDRISSQSVKTTANNNGNGNININMTNMAASSRTRNSSMNRVQARGMPQRHPHIGPVDKSNKGKKCLVLDLDETLVHSSLREESLAHMVIPVNIDNAIHDVYVIKRPGVDEFLTRMGEIFEIFIYTASLSKYADPLLDKLDKTKVISKRLFRENCVYHEGHYVKDLSLLNRDLQQCIIVDNSPMSYIFHPENAIDCGSFIDDMGDIEMWLIGDFLQGISKCDDVRSYCNKWREWCKKHPNQSTVPKHMLE